MPTQQLPQTIPLPFTTLVQLANEAWRLSKWLAPVADASGSAPARYALRRLEQILKQHDFEFRDLDGHAYDPGMAVEVVDVTEDPALPAGQSTVVETMQPQVLYRGNVVQVATVAIRKGTNQSSSTTQG